MEHKSIRLQRLFLCDSVVGDNLVRLEKIQ